MIRGFEFRVWTSRVRRVLPVIVVCLAAVCTNATEIPPDRGFAIDKLGRSEGLPSTQVHAVEEGPSGAVWSAGPAGLSRYDGSRIQVFGPLDGLSTQGLRSLAVGPDGSLWIGHDRGVDRRKSDGVIETLSDEAWEFGFVDAIAVDQDGAWFGTNTGLVRWTASKGAALEASLPVGLVSGLLLTGEQVWASGPTIGLWLRDDNGWQHVPDEALETILPAHTLAPAEGGKVWVGGARGFALLDAQGQPRGLWAGGGGESTVTALLPVDGELWVARGGNLDAWTQIGDDLWAASGRIMNDVRVNQLSMDKNGNVWIATDSDGLAKISVLRRAISHWGMPCDTQVYSIRPVGTEGFLVGGEQCSWMMNSIDSPPIFFSGLNRVKVWDLVESRSGASWAATQQGLFVSRAGGAFAPARLGSPLDTVPCRALLEREDGLWVATVEGLFVIESGAAREIHDSDGNPLGYVYTLSEAPDGRLWVGTIGRGALREANQGGLSNLEDPLMLDSSNVYAIAHDGTGGVALIQDTDVLYSNGTTWRLLERATDNNVGGWSLLFDGPSDLWLGSSSGLVQYYMPAGTVQRRLTEAMGLSGQEFTTSRSLAQDSEGRLLLGLDSGLSVVDPTALDKVTRAPEPHLSSVDWTNATVQSRDGIPAVAHGAWTLDLGLASSWFIDEQGLMYRYRLDGFDHAWSAPRNRAQANARFTGLPSGEYGFVAQAFSPLFGWGQEMELFRFQVDHPWWKESAFVGLWVLLGVVAVAGLTRWRTSTLSHRALHLEGLVEKRTLELQQANRELERLASQDSLTGLKNRRALWSDASRYEAIARRENLTLGLLLIDLDHFKSINDQYGHTVGDAVLVHVGEVITKVLRKGEVLARWGGEEFAVLLAPALRRTDLRSVGERMRMALAGHPAVLEDGRTIPLTCSVGAASWDPVRHTIEEPLKRADQALYEAKKNRDRTVVMDEHGASAARSDDEPHT